MLHPDPAPTSQPNIMPNVVIIGGGISGLSTAYYLAKAGAPSTIVESRPRLGGVIQTERVDGCTIEAGPDSFLAVQPAALDLLMMMVPTKILPLVPTSLLSLGTKIRMGLELFRAPKPKSSDQSVADFVREHYGREAVDYLAEPLLSGIYGGDPRQLSVTAVLPRFVELAAKYGSLTRGVLAMRAPLAKGQQPSPLFRTLKGGLGQLIDAVKSSIERKTTVVAGRAETIERLDTGFRVRIAGDWLAADHVVVACEAHNAAPLVASLDPPLGAPLGAPPRHRE